MFGSEVWHCLVDPDAVFAPQAGGGGQRGFGQDAHADDDEVGWNSRSPHCTAFYPRRCPENAVTDMPQSTRTPSRSCRRW